MSKAGEFLKYTPKNRGAEGVGVRSHDVTTPTYKELGTTKMEVPRESVNKDRSIFEKKGS